MENLIKALQIFLKYGNPEWPTHCEHDNMVICGIEPSEVSNEDKKELEDLGFLVGNQFGEEAFHSYRYGSA